MRSWGRRKSCFSELHVSVLYVDNVGIDCYIACNWCHAKKIVKNALVYTVWKKRQRRGMPVCGGHCLLRGLCTTQMLAFKSLHSPQGHQVSSAWKGWKCNVCSRWRQRSNAFSYYFMLTEILLPFAPSCTEDRESGRRQHLLTTKITGSGL